MAMELIDHSSAYGDVDLPRYSVVSDWYDADHMAVADLSNEIVGQRVFAFTDDAQRVEPYSPIPGKSVTADFGVPGFIFSGDDGDSLWFWPELEDMAFRFEPETGNRVRQELSEGISRLVSQGALVYCRKVDLGGDTDPVFEFLTSEAEAA